MLAAEHAYLYGDNVSYVQTQQVLQDWQEADDRAVWLLNLREGSAYAVFLEYSTLPTDDTTVTTYAVDTQEASFTGELERTRDVNASRRVLIGDVYLTHGESSLSVRNPNLQQPMNLLVHKLYLVPLSTSEYSLRRLRTAGNTPRLIHADQDGGFKLPVTDCEIYGGRSSLQQTQKSLALWSNPESQAVWTLNVTQPGTFLVFLEYASGRKAADNRFTLASGNSRLSRSILSTGSWDRYRQQFVGSFSLEPRVRRITFCCTSAEVACGIDLRRISLVPDISEPSLEE